MVQQSRSRRAVRPAIAAATLGIGLSTLWLKSSSDPDFPRPFKTGPRTTVFYEHELEEYLARCAEKSRKATAGIDVSPMLSIVSDAEVISDTQILQDAKPAVVPSFAKAHTIARGSAK
jgi:predicted DNA-binding transcriptional regulator AlpA